MNAKISVFIICVKAIMFTSPSDFAPASSKEFLDIQATIECGFTLKRVRDMRRTYNHVCYYIICMTVPLRPVFC